MRLVMMGTGPFGVPTFRALCDEEHVVVALVTGPLRQRGKRPPPDMPLRTIAAEHGMPIFDPADANAAETRARLAEYRADLLIVCDYGQILSAQTLATSRLGGLNLHGSLLPKYRGAAPIQWAIYHGENESGVSVIHMTPQVDAGPVVAQAGTPIGPEETAAELETRLSELGAGLILGALADLEAGVARKVPQDPALASKAPRLTKADGQVDWSRPATTIKNHVRAMQPWPKSFTFWHRPNGKPMRLTLGPVRVGETSDKAAPPGTVLEVERDRILVAAGEGTVVLEHLQPSGKRLLSIGEFQSGYPIESGQRFGGD